jgi:hypothetical protein
MRGYEIIEAKELDGEVITWSQERAARIAREHSADITEFYLENPISKGQVVAADLLIWLGY